MEKFLTEKYTDLPGSEPVERAVKKKIRQGEKGPSTKENRVEVYLERLEGVINNPRALERLKYQILDKYTTKFEDIPESYWNSLAGELRRRGEGGDWENVTEEQKEELKQKNAEVVLTDQRDSLEQWVDYFASSDSAYIPTSLKYWIFRNIIGLQDLVKKKDGDKEYIEFPKRSKGTVKPYPDINHEALAYVVDAVIKHREGKGIEFEYDIQQEERKEFEQFLAKENFAELYAWSNELMNPIPEHLLPITTGQWVKYDQNSDPKNLVGAIRGHSTGWCTAGLNTARTHLQGGDFYVYYTLDDDQKMTIPRLAIRMEGQDKIAEDPRGIAYKQNLDPYMVPILEKKLAEFGPIGEVYQKKSADMKYLTEIEHKTEKNILLTKEDLLFLYEVNSSIEGFGYKKDPRIAEIREKRNLKEDLPILFACEPAQIAQNIKELKPDTVAYIGPWNPAVLNVLPKTVTHIYESFPDKKVFRKEIIPDSKITSAETARARLTAEGHKISDYSQGLLTSVDWSEKLKSSYEVVSFSVSDLFGDTKIHTYAEIKAKALEQNLDLVPQSLAPSIRLNYEKKGEWTVMAMNPVRGRVGDLRLFHCRWSVSGSWLYDNYGRDDDEWHRGRRFFFVRK